MHTPTVSKKQHHSIGKENSPASGPPLGSPAFNAMQETHMVAKSPTLGGRHVTSQHQHQPAQSRGTRGGASFQRCGKQQ